MKIINRFTQEVIKVIDIEILSGANLGGANLRGANLDFSCWPLWCGSFNAKVDDRLVWQLICHITRLDVSECSDEAKKAVQSLFHWQNKFCEFRPDVKPLEGNHESL